MEWLIILHQNRMATIELVTLNIKFWQPFDNYFVLKLLVFRSQTYFLSIFLYNDHLTDSS